MSFERWHFVVSLKMIDVTELILLLSWQNMSSYAVMSLLWNRFTFWWVYMMCETFVHDGLAFGVFIFWFNSFIVLVGSIDHMPYTYHNSFAVDNIQRQGSMSGCCLFVLVFWWSYRKVHVQFSSFLVIDMIEQSVKDLCAFETCHGVVVAVRKTILEQSLSVKG